MPVMIRKEKAVWWKDLLKSSEILSRIVEWTSWKRHSCQHSWRLCGSRCWEDPDALWAGEEVPQGSHFQMTLEIRPLSQAFF